MKKLHSLVLITASLAGSVSPLIAGGYEAKLWNSDSIGEALAGSSVKEGDITTMTRNPASALGFMTSPYQVAVASTVVLPSIKFKDKGSKVASGAALTGSNGGNGGKDAVVPAAYLAWNFNKDVKFGLAITSPWGLKTDYEEGWKGRYHALRSELKTINIMPAVAYKVNEQFAIGAGVQIQYMDVRLSRAIDFGSFFGASQAYDGGVKLKGDKWSYGWNVGLAYRLLKNVRLGLNYTSQVHHKLTGKANFEKPAAIAPYLNAPRFNNQGIKADVKTPERVILGAAWDFHPQMTLLGEVNYTQWKRMKEINVRFATPGVVPDITPMKWRNTVSYHLGLNWRPSEEWTFRTGYAFDPSAVRDDHRTPAVPDQERHWAALGATWTPTEAKDVSFSINYAHEFVRKAKSKLNDASRGNLVGSYKTSVDLVSAQIKWRF
ncbi:MAG: outer membrane protein transport protein [Candidatus Paracaedimonas acanthamoebae]|uniref:Outer membrane protein transport protein n=1 Tax=Candidatus Paracaedimonas acanthamoebae TaxID=244581 RepID=A0A8J7TSW9_9PROT|nr:outer membrane protein transport protein [Candidatus Paracaedimonas acanthamoebae]